MPSLGASAGGYVCRSAMVHARNTDFVDRVLRDRVTHMSSSNVCRRGTAIVQFGVGSKSDPSRFRVPCAQAVVKAFRGGRAAQLATSVSCTASYTTSA